MHVSLLLLISYVFKMCIEVSLVITSSYRLSNSKAIIEKCSKKILKEAQRTQISVARFCPLKNLMDHFSSIFLYSFVYMRHLYKYDGYPKSK